jgi:hypothetical protein
MAAKFGAACVLSLCAAAPAPVRAATLDDLLDLLKAKGDITQAEYSKLKAREQEESKKNEEKLRAAEAKARAAEARARAAEARASEGKAVTRAPSSAPPLELQSSNQPQTPAQSPGTVQPQEISQAPSRIQVPGTGPAPVTGQAIVQAQAPAPAPGTGQAQGAGQAGDSAQAADNTQTLAEAEAIARAQTLTAADLPMPAKSPVQYVTVLPNCVGVRVGTVDVCIKGDLSFFATEQFPDKSATPATVSGGLATVDQTNSNSIRGGLLPSSIQLGINTNQAGIDVGVYLGVYSGGNNIGPGTAFNANSPGSPVSLGTPGIDFRQFYGTIGTPSFGTVKVGRDIGLFASDAILNDLTLFGVGTPAGNFAPGETSLGRIGIGYLYADFIPQIIYTTPNWAGFTASGGIFTPYDETSAFAADPLESGTMSGHDTPELQGQLKFVTGAAPTGKITLSADALWQRQVADCPTGSSCLTNGTGLMTAEQLVNAWAVDGFGMLDIGGFNFVAYVYDGKGVGTTGMFFDGVDIAGDPRSSYGGYLQGAYTFDRVTVGASYGVSYLDTANAFDAANVAALCVAGTECLVHKNESWIGFVRYKLTNWVKLQAEYIYTRDQNAIGGTNYDNAVVAGTTFFW